MVFPRRGCQTCRKRRVKCDAVQPTCGRCVKAKRTCEWDPDDQSGLHFKSENAFAQGQPRRPRRSKEHTSDQSLVGAPSRPAISSALSVPLEVQSFQYWVQNHVFRLDDLPDMGQEYVNYVLIHWVNAQPESSLHLALSALTHAIFGRARHANEATRYAQRFYARSIVKAHQDIDELASESIDKLLLAIMLMNYYENIVYDPKTGDTPSLNVKNDEVGSRLWKSVCHQEGAISLLRLRREQGSNPKLPLDKVVRRQIIRICILRGLGVPKFLQNGAVYGEEGPALGIDSLMVRVANLRADSLNLFGKHPNIALSQQQLAHFAARALEVDTALAAWACSVPEDWRFSVLSSGTDPSLLQNDLFYGGVDHSYTTHGHASVWNRYRALRLIVNSIRNRALSKVPGDSIHAPAIVAQQESCRKTMELMANDLCGSIPYFFNSPTVTGEEHESRVIIVRNHFITTEGDILPKMATLLAWPLTVAVSTEGLPDPQRQWLRHRLVAVAHSLGDAALESVAGEGEFKF